MTTPVGATTGLGPSLVRTLVPILVGPLVTRFFPGLDINDQNTTLVVSAIVSYLYYVLVRVLETKAPSLGYLLGIAKAPAYSPKDAPQPEPPTGGGPGAAGAPGAQALATPEDEVKPSGVPAYEFEDATDDDLEPIADAGAPVEVKEVEV